MHDKIVIIGDLHGSDAWKKIVENNYDASKIIFLGDYFDSFEEKDFVKNFKEIMEFKKKNYERVEVLIGNHDYHYLIPSSKKCSGYNPLKYPDYYDVLNREKYNLKVAYKYGDYLFSHAGVSSIWLEQHIPAYKIDTLDKDINELFLYKPDCFENTGVDPYGDYIGEGPLWIRPESLSKDINEINDYFTQIVGHTGGIKNTHYKNEGVEIIFCDIIPEGLYYTLENKQFILHEIDKDRSLLTKRV